MSQIKINQTKDKYDVIIIGSGLGGLTAANRLGKEGHSVLLLEQHNKLGGLATWFKRKDDHIFDISLHGFPTGMKKTCRKYWSQEIADQIIQLKGIRFDNPQFSFETTFDREDFTKILQERFRIDKEIIDNFFNTARSMDFLDDQTMTVRELFNKFFPGRDDVVRMLMEPIAYANGSTLDEPALTYGIVFSNFMSKGVYTFKGGTDKMISMMTLELLKNKVDIITNAIAEKVEIDKDKKVAGVISCEKKIEAKAVISNSNLLSTINSLVGNDYFSDDYKEKANNLHINTSSCQVYIGIKKGQSIPYIGDLIFTSTHEKFDSNALLSKDITSRTFSVYYPDIRPGFNDYTIVASSNARYEDWENLTEEEYQKDKAKLIESTLDCLARYIPDVRSKIGYVEAATPKTFKRYTLHEKGSSFGTKFEGLKISMEMPKEIGGLFHTGSVGIIMSGWLGAANYGAIVSNEVDKYLVKVKS
ncbi:MAG: NAD(P)-binding protein [bacterium]